MDSHLGQTAEVALGPSPELEPDATPDATLWGDVVRKLRKDPRFIISAGLIVVFCAMGLVPRLFTGADPKSCDILNFAQRPSSGHWFGTDILGCDYYSRVIYGARTSLEVGLIVSSLSIVIALSFGAAAGYFGGWVDILISRLIELFLNFPQLFLILATTLAGRGYRTVRSLLRETTEPARLPAA